jgi:hypothetical protein
MTADTSDTTAAPRSRQLLELVLGDEPQAWRDAGFDVAADGTFSLGATTVRCAGTGDGFVSWSLDGVVGTELDGLALAAPTAASPAPDAHPNGISSIDHVVVRTGDVGRSIAAFERAGFEVRGGRSTTSYGAPMRQTFFWAGDVILELVGPDEGEPTTDETTSIFGLALVADDLDATAAQLGELMGTPKDAVQPGRRIAGLRGATVGIGLPVAVMSPHPATA